MRSRTGAGGRLIVSNIGRHRGMTAGDLFEAFKDFDVITGAALVVPGDVPGGRLYVVRATYTGVPGVNARVEFDTVAEDPT